MADKDFRVKNKLHVNGLNNASGVILATNNALDSHTTLPTQYGGTGTTTSPNAGQILYSSSGTNYTPTTLSSLDVKGATYSADAPSSPFVGQVWIESDSSSDSFDPNIMRRKTITATAGQTVFTTDFTFIDGYEQVYFNGMLLLRTTDYTTSGSSSTVTLTSAAAVNDIVEIVTITNLNSINAATTTTNTFTGQQTIQGNLVVGGSIPNLSSSTKAITVDSSSASDYAALEMATGGTLRGYLNATNGAMYIAAVGSNPLVTYTNGSERMRIDSSGKVGIGTNSPLYKLHVDGSMGVWAGSGRLMFASNTQSLPGSDDGTATNMPFGFSGNLSNGAAEMNIWNTINLSSTSDGGKGFTFNQKTGASTYEMPFRITGNGYLYQTDILGARETGLIRNYSTTHVAANRNASFLVGLNDGSFTGMGVYNTASSNTAYNSQYIAFTTHEGGVSVAERMRISSTGKVGIGTIPSTGILEILSTDSTAPRLINTSNNNNKLIVFEGYAGGLWNFYGGHGGNSYFGISENASSTPVFAITGSTNYVLVGYTTSQGAYKLQVNSQIFATSSTIATSDGRFKENVSTINSGLNIIDALRPVSFTWKEHAVHNFPEGKTVGFIAQEVQEALSDYDWKDNIIKSNISEAVLDEEGNIVHPEEEFLGIAEGNLIPLLVAAVKELKSRVETLEAANV